MLHAFNTLGSESGVADPRQLSGNINTVLVSTAIGVGLNIIGLVLVCIALFAKHYRAKWLFWFLIGYGSLVGYSSLLLPGFPVGSVLGIIILIYCIIKKAQFLQQPPAT